MSGGQYVVAVFLDATLVVSATGPFRSGERALAVCDRLNKASEWTEDNPEGATLTAQVVLLLPETDLLESLSEPD